MQLHRYLARTFVQLFISISCSLTVLCSLVEFLERLRNTAHLSTSEIVTFVTLNIAPTWLGLLPITCWLTTVATLYQLDRMHELHICQVLGIRPWQLMRPLILALLSILGLTLLAKQLFLDDLAYRAREYHTQVISHKPTHVVNNMWCQLDTNAVCSVGSYTHQTHKGTDLVLYTYNAGKQLVSITHAPTFTLLGTVLHAPQAVEYNQKTGTTAALCVISKALPTLATALATHHPPHTLLDMCFSWWHAPHQSQRKLIKDMLTKETAPLWWGLVYALAALMVFFVNARQMQQRLLFTILSYPALVLVQSFIR